MQYYDDDGYDGYDGYDDYHGYDDYDGFTIHHQWTSFVFIWFMGWRWVYGRCWSLIPFLFYWTRTSNKYDQSICPTDSKLVYL